MNQIWQTEIQYLKKVGPMRAELLGEECQIYRYSDLLQYFPYRYLDKTKVLKVSQIQQVNQNLNLIGKITNVETIDIGRKKILKAQFNDGTGNVELVWFSGIRWVHKALKINEKILIFGKITYSNQMLQIAHPEIHPLSSDNDNAHNLRIIPFYNSTEKLKRSGLDAKGFRSIIFELFNQAFHSIEENLSPEIMKKYKLVSRKVAMKNIHFPENFHSLQQAQRRLKFEEFFFFQLMLAQKQILQKRKNRSFSFKTVGNYFNNFYKNHLQFELTNAQKRVIKEIRQDLRQEIQMNRLLQGDVGSGKTIVAFLCMLIALDNNFQAAMLAPTEILATQHYKKLKNYAEKIGVVVELIKGKQTKKQRTEILEKLQSGEIQILVGTHAMLEPPVKFKNLAFVIIDEQHKFGVVQRAKLWKKAKYFPHNLLMSATPIPRTLAMSLYGDVDVSVIDELPKGRKPIKTHVMSEGKRLQMLGFVKKQIQNGHQAYFVYPLVEESKKLDLLAVEQGFEHISDYFKEYQVGIVHGRMKPEVKDFEMQRFVRGETKILVATTVIEVGVDVPNANIMVIENAERFGLSQLHQLRGRVGRGAEQSFAILMYHKAKSKESKARLKAMAETTNGFKIAEMDLELRGPGDFLGTKQSGLPEFKLANIVEDAEILTIARQAAFQLSQIDPTLSAPGNAHIKIYAQRYFHKNKGFLGIA